jgi:hypothetical protein
MSFEEIIRNTGAAQYGWTVVQLPEGWDGFIAPGWAHASARELFPRPWRRWSGRAHLYSDNDPWHLRVLYASATGWTRKQCHRRLIAACEESAQGGRT